MIVESDGSVLPVDEREGLVLFFTVGGHIFATRLTEVVRIDDVDINAVDETSSAEERIGCLDLRRFFDAGAGEGSGKTITIVFEGEDGRFSLLADAVEKIVPAQEAPEVGWPSQLGGEAAKIFGGFFRRGEQLALSVNVPGLKEAANRQHR